MPTAYVKKIAKKKKMPISEVEKKWEDAKEISKKIKGKRDNWAYTMGIFKKMCKVEESNVIKFTEFIELQQKPNTP